MDIQVSYLRMLIGDNSRSAPVYTDAEIRSAVTISPARPALPIGVRLPGTLTAIRYPEGPF